MKMNIYVSNLSCETTGDELKKVFTTFGEVRQVVIVVDDYLGRCQTGYHGYVEMATKEDGAAAITNLNGTKIGGRVISTIEALPLTNKNTGKSHLTFGA